MLDVSYLDALVCVFGPHANTVSLNPSAGTSTHCAVSNAVKELDATHRLLHFSAFVPAAQALHIASPEGPERAGLDAALIASFPSYPYKVPAALTWRAAASMGAASTLQLDIFLQIGAC